MKIYANYFVWLLLVVVNFTAYSQKKDIDVDKLRDDVKETITNWYELVDVKKCDTTFEIIYNINSSKDDEYEVSVVLARDSDTNFRIIPIHVIGKIGKGYFAGKNNSIIWKYKKDILTDLKGNDYHFDLTVIKMEHRSFPWVLTGVGVVGVGVVGWLLYHPKSIESIPELRISRPN